MDKVTKGRLAERDQSSDKYLRSCDTCRRQKDKCDGGVPCRRCIRLQRECEFLSVPSRASGTGPEDEARHEKGTELEQRVRYMGKILTHYTGIVDLNLETLRELADSCDKKSVQSRPPRSDVQSLGSSYAGVDEERFTVQPLPNNITHYSGEFSHWNFSMRIKQWIEQSVLDRGSYMATDAPEVKDYWRAEDLRPPSDTITSLSSLPPRYVANFLAQVFFKYTESNYFYIDRGWLLEKLNTAYERPTSLSRGDVCTVCILFSVFAIGTQYAYLDSANGNQSHGPQAPRSGQGPFSEDSIGIQFYQQACRLLPDVIAVGSLESVQACLLIGIYLLPLDAAGLSYIYLNLALKLAIQNGMHRKCTEANLEPIARETRNRVWWTAYITERRVGIFHGRPTSIPSSEIDADLPRDRPDLWPLNPPCHYPYMMATIQLNQALNRITEELSLLKTNTKLEISDQLGKVVGLETKLENWWQKVPRNGFGNGSSHSAPVLRSNTHLKLEYYLVRMFAGRSFLFPRESGRGASSCSGSAAGSPSCVSTSVRANARSTLVTSCVDAAISAIDTLRLLRSSIGLARASYTEFSACRAALLVIIAQCLQKKTDRLREALHHGMSMIKEMATGGESASSEASLIEAFERAIARLDDGDEDLDAESRSDYANFKKWEKLRQTTSSGASARGHAIASAPMPFPPQAVNLSQQPSFDTSRYDAIRAPLTIPFFSTDASFQPFPPPTYEYGSLFGFDFALAPGEMNNEHDDVERI